MAYLNKIDINGDFVGGDSVSGDFGETNYSSYEDENGSARQGKLTFQGKTFYPINHENQRQNKVKKYVF